MAGVPGADWTTLPRASITCTQGPPIDATPTTPIVRPAGMRPRWCRGPGSCPRRLVGELALDEGHKGPRAEAQCDPDEGRGDQRDPQPHRPPRPGPHRATRSLRHRAPPGSRRPDGLDGVEPEGDVDLLAEVADVHLDDVGIAGEVGSPDLVEQLLLGGHPTLASQQRLQHGELAGREVHLLALAMRGPGVGVDDERADRDRRRPRRVAAAEQSGRRATRTTNEKGFERKSSAPVSRASASSYSPDLAVSTRIGVQLPSARRALHTLKPFIPGSSRSSTIAAYWCSWARQ